MPVSRPDGDGGRGAPRCPRCDVPLLRAALPPEAFGIPLEACADCGDAVLDGAAPWACPKCAAVYLLRT